MSHFAELDENNIVLRVLVGDNNLPDEGKSWFEENLGGKWVQTSYNGNFRKRFAGIGFTYNENLDAFIPPKPFDSWVLDEELCDWVPPKSKPAEGDWYWNEELGDWAEIVEITND